MPTQRGLIAVLCLLATTPASSRRLRLRHAGKYPHIRWMDLLSVNGCNPMMQDTESTNALRAINSMDLLGVKSRASRGSGEGLSTSHTRFCTRVTAGLFT